MRYNNTLGLIPILLLFLGVLGYAQDAPMQVLEPKNESIHTRDTISVVVLLAPKSYDTIKIFTDRNERYTIKVKPDRDTYCKTISIHPGNNKIRIRAYFEGKKVKEEVRKLYLMAPLSKEHKFPPEGYTPEFFHTDQQEMLCGRCHDMSVNEVKGVAFINVKDSNCYQCHSSFMKKEERHAPAVNWLCTSCHSGKTAEKNADSAGKSKFLSPDPIMETCLSCHKKTRELWKDKKYRHDPAAFGRCDRCHDPHASEHHFIVREAVWDLCRSCHSNKASQKAFLEEYMNLAERPLDPAKTGKEFNCASCHNPHVSDEGFFLQPGYSDDRSLCRRMNIR